MKKSLLTVTILCAALYAFAAPVNSVIRNGRWTERTTWSLNKLPQTGDTVVVPKNYTLTVDANLDLTSQNLYLKVDGTLNLVNGKLDMGPNSVLLLTSDKASVVPNKNNPSNKLMIMGVEKYVGSMGAEFGPAYINSKVSSFTPIVYSALPVKFVGFSVARSSGSVLVQWATAEEAGADRFEIERSTNGTTWNTIAYVAAAGNTTSLTNYSFKDRNAVEQVVYYRIRQVDFDGRFTYTAVKTVGGTNAATAKVAISTNQTSNVLIQFGQEVKSTVNIQIISLNGQVIARQQFAQPGSQIVLNKIAAPKGAYVVAVEDGKTIKAASQVML